MARLTLGEIRTEVRAKTHNTSLTDAQINTWANLAQDEVVRAMDPDWLTEVRTFTTFANQRKYFLQDIAFAKVKSVVDQTSRFPLSQTTEKYIDNIDPGHIRTGRSTMYAIYGLQTFVDPPSTYDGATFTVSIVSSSASDTLETVTIRGYTTETYSAVNPSATMRVEVQETLTLNGVTPVNGTVSFEGIYSVEKSADTVGSVEVSIDDGVTSPETIAFIDPDDRSTQFQPMVLFPTPSSANTIRVTYIRRAETLVNDNEEPNLPDAWHDLVLIGTLIEAHKYLYEFEIADKLNETFLKKIKDLHNEQGNTRDNSRKVRLPSLVAMKRYKGRLPEPLG